jgi:hypothetical protein
MNIQHIRRSYNQISLEYTFQGENELIFEIPTFTLIDKESLYNWIFFLSNKKWMDGQSLQFLISYLNGYFDSTNKKE